ncbi:hypothetical protein Bpfe_024415 [Biomphalaria pfeifferi]|uniref:Uncharacterized protein n=1 Tax=Biomphalaria pfeifferi TaxID=112525 RepID=A0AAD8B149_BIOPF|nr:hypothetical protein Bpfe_024415 [Biomphalaria pfeifferi]
MPITLSHLDQTNRSYRPVVNTHPGVTINNEYITRLTGRGEWMEDSGLTTINVYHFSDVGAGAGIKTKWRLGGYLTGSIKKSQWVIKTVASSPFAPLDPPT